MSVCVYIYIYIYIYINPHLRNEFQLMEMKNNRKTSGLA